MYQINERLKIAPVKIFRIKSLRVREKPLQVVQEYFWLLKTHVPKKQLQKHVKELQFFKASEHWKILAVV